MTHHKPPGGERAGHEEDRQALGKGCLSSLAFEIQCLLEGGHVVAQDDGGKGGDPHNSTAMMRTSVSKNVCEPQKPLKTSPRPICRSRA